MNFYRTLMCDFTLLKTRKLFVIDYISVYPMWRQPPHWVHISSSLLISEKKSCLRTMEMRLRRAVSISHFAKTL